MPILSSLPGNRGDRMDQSSDLTVLICTWNRASLLEETLVSLREMNVPFTSRWEVVVVDNNSTDGTADVVARLSRSFPTRLDYVFEPRQGKSHAMNAGVCASSYPIVAFCDDDVRVHRAWLTAAAGAFRDRPDIAYVGGPVDPIWEQPCPAWFAHTGKLLWGTLAILDYGDEPFVFEERRRVP